jgi:hypothetical protein
MIDLRFDSIKVFWKRGRSQLVIYSLCPAWPGSMTFAHTKFAQRHLLRRTFVQKNICPERHLPRRHLPRKTFAQKDICPEDIFPEGHFPRKIIAQKDNCQKDICPEDICPEGHLPRKTNTQMTFA